MASLARCLAACEAAIADLRLVHSEIERQLVTAMKEANKREIEVAGEGTFKRQSEVSRTEWKHEMLAAKIASIALDNRPIDDETGEVQDPAIVIYTALLKACGISYWRVGELKKLGLDPETYCTTRWGGEKIRRL